MIILIQRNFGNPENKSRKRWFEATSGDTYLKNINPIFSDNLKGNKDRISGAIKNFRHSSRRQDSVIPFDLRMGMESIRSRKDGINNRINDHINRKANIKSLDLDSDKSQNVMNGAILAYGSGKNIKKVHNIEGGRYTGVSEIQTKRSADLEKKAKQQFKKADINAESRKKINKVISEL